MPELKKDWSVSRAKRTLDKLRNEYPGYTDNELYAIWCVQNDCYPKGATGKLDLASWQKQAAVDGEALFPDTGFRVSRALYGRALKAEAGVHKPQVPRTAGGSSNGAPSVPGVSEKAIRFAQRYVLARELVESLASKQVEIDSLLEQMRSLSPTLLEEVATEVGGVEPMLRDEGLL